MGRVLGASALAMPLLALAVLTLAVLTLAGCRREPTRWEVDWSLPLVDDWVGWERMLAVEGLEGLELEPGGGGVPGVIRFTGAVGSWDWTELSVLPDTLVSNDLTPAFAGGPFAVPPGTTLLETTENIEFQGIEQQFKWIVLEAGCIEYVVESTTDGYVALQYRFPGVTRGGQEVVLDVQLPPAAPGETQSKVGALDLGGALIDLRGSAGTDFNRIASVLTIGTPADVDYTAQVYGTDSIRVRLHFQDLRVREVRGYFGQEEIALDVRDRLVQPDRGATGFLDWEATRARLLLSNRMGADLRFQFDGLRLDGTALDHPQWGVPQFCARAQDSGIPGGGAGGWAEVPVWSLDLLEAQPSLFSVLGGLPDSLVLTGSAMLNPLGDVTGANDFFRTDAPPEVALELEVPLRVGVQDLVLRDSRELAAVEVPDFEGVLDLRFTNGFPVNLRVEGVWVPHAPGAETVPFSLRLTGRGMPDSEAGPVGSLQLPVTGEALREGGRLEWEARVDTPGRVVFSGRERIRLQVRAAGSTTASFGEE